MARDPGGAPGTGSRRRDAEDVPTPDFFIAGAPRSGTTSMYEYLRSHPDIFMPEWKEPHFFAPDLSPDEEFIRDGETYLELFAGAGEATRRGEASTWYLHSREAADGIRAFEPDARIIIMLRDPVEMIASLHRKNLYHGLEELEDLEEALEAETARARGERLPDPAGFRECLQYREAARYADGVARFLDGFPPGAVRILLFEDFVTDPGRTYGQVLRFLGVPDDGRSSFDTHNRNRRVRSEVVRRLLRRPPKLLRILAGALPAWLRWRGGGFLRRANTVVEARSAPDPRIVRRLREELAPDVRRLEELIGRDLSTWLPEGGA